MPAPSTLIPSSTAVDPRAAISTRRRSHILKRAQSQLANSSCHLTSPSQKDLKRRLSHTEETSPSLATDDESQSETSLEPAAAVSDKDTTSSTAEEHRKKTVPSPLHTHSHHHTKHDHGKVHARSWYEFDLAVVVALVSPVGHWLTGGDHIKNLFLVVLLIYYLHQIIEVPWTLYQRARQQRPLPYLAAPTVEEKYQQIAASELRKLELFFLSLTALSPFFGAMFLRYATAATIGPQAISWFNTGLFVLATGMRPWAHVVERLKQRTTDLHDVINHPALATSSSTMPKDLIERVEDLTMEVSRLEKRLKKTDTKMTELIEGVYDYVDEVVDRVDKVVRKHEKKHERHDVRVKDMEDAFTHFKQGQSRQKSSLGFRLLPMSLLRYFIPAWLYSPSYRSIIAAVYSPVIPPSESSKSSPSQSKSTSLSSVAPQLDALQEEEIRQYPLLAQPTSVTSGLLSRVGNLVTMPLRAVIRMMLGRY
ncbi:hypothetical protein AMATHDRAFT_64510 [Amanita thiersii Skay4041]|uniref:Uncharacterized protein n=1 Tax=Amanita thiersii Skay4041 TaxID=703135 RepID=A0A2A9NCU0_9AGAR|nr:hypothetical protein AMATHDRAFT_64510 [Amanita thiersii Skay4041]